MYRTRPRQKPLWFCVKFVVFVTILVMLWWWMLPAYGWLLLQVSGGFLKHVLGVPVVSGAIVPKEVLNTGTDLVFNLSTGQRRVMHIGLLATNIPPYAALVLATGGLAMRRRVRGLVYGLLILCLFHVSFIIVAMRYQDALMRASEIPTAVVQFFLTMPFLLWIVFAYWDRLFQGSAPAEDQGKDGARKTPEEMP
mgnify:CR=1 FL=1